ncbi:RDD family protein [Actinomadura viridis]|uniref:RDD family protein n=1 Tax=Actinomadura viridis TaxID=58110 RepID=UPI003680E2DB
MTPPPQNPPSGEQPEDRPWPPPDRSGQGPEEAGERHGEEPPPAQPYGGQPPYGGAPPYGGYQQPDGAAPAFYGAAHTDLASRWARLGALILDDILLAVVTGIVTLPFYDWDRTFNPVTGTSIYWGPGNASGNLLALLIVFLYYWLLTARWGQTLGKKVLGIRVVREQDGGAISSGASAWRYGVQLLLAIPCGLGTLLDALWIFWDPRKQTIHDKAAQTLVVKVRPGVPDPYERR